MTSLLKQVMNFFIEIFNHHFNIHISPFFLVFYHLMKENINCAAITIFISSFKILFEQDHYHRMVLYHHTDPLLILHPTLEVEVFFNLLDSLQYSHYLKIGFHYLLITMLMSIFEMSMGFINFLLQAFLNVINV